jgi:hypothetical protein
MPAFHSTDALQNTLEGFQADVEQAISDVISKVLIVTPRADKGTRIIDITSASTTLVKRRVSTSSATTIDIQCPAGT